MRLINLQDDTQCMSVPTGWVLGMIELGQLNSVQLLDGSIAIDACQIEANNWDCARQDSAASYAHLMEMSEKMALCRSQWNLTIKRSDECVQC